MESLDRNRYILNVDIKRRLSNKTPRFVQFDSAEIVFKLFDDGKPFDLSNFNSIIVTHKLLSGKVITGDAKFITLDGHRVISYVYKGSEMNEIGAVETSLSAYNDTNKISIMPFTVEIVKDQATGLAEGATPEFNILQDMIVRVSVAEDNALYAREQGEIAHTEAQYAKTQGDHAKEQGDLAETASANANTAADRANTAAGKADAATQAANTAAEYANTQAARAEQAADTFADHTHSIEDVKDYMNSTATDKDKNGIFRIVEYQRLDGTLYLRSTMSNPNTEGNYQTVTLQIYAPNGSTLSETKVWTLTYDEDGSIVNKEVV